MRALVFIVLALQAPLAWGAACCGGGTSYPNLMTTPSFAQMSLSSSFANVAARRDALDGKIYETANWDSEKTQTYQLATAFLLTDTWQAGFRLPLVRRALDVSDTRSQKTQLGDAYGTIAWEYWPNYEYQSLKPRGYAFAELRAPLATSFYDSSDALGADVAGSGQWELALGNLWLKEWNRTWDASFAIRGGLFLGRTFADRENLGLPTHLGLSSSLGVGFSPGGGRLRFGASLGPNWEQGFTTTSNLGSSEQDERMAWTTTLKANYLVGDALSTELSYSDETWVRLGTQQPALSRTLGLQLLYHWNL